MYAATGTQAELKGSTRYLPFDAEDVIMSVITADYDMDSTEERIVIAHNPEAPGFIVTRVMDDGHLGTRWVHGNFALKADEFASEADAIAAFNLAVADAAAGY